MDLAPKLESQSVGYYRYYPTLILGKGNFATVYLARHRIVKCDVALKIVNTDDIKEDYVRRNLHREEKIMRNLHHPNIIRLYEVVEEKNFHCLSLEYVRGVNLYQYMTNQPNHRIPEKLARLFFYQMLSAVEYMHNLNVIHRDLKLENILVEYGHIIKVADFGLSNVYYPCLELRTHCGSIEYAAPELFKSSAYGTPADVWSLGVILYVMVVGKMPFVFCQKKGEYAFNARMRHLFMQRISKGLIQENWELMENLSPECWDLLHGLLQPDQFTRIRIEDAIEHPWLTKDKYLAKRLPQKRKDLQRKFHPEVIEYLAFKLNTSKSRIETHLNVYQNDKIAAMYFIVREVLVKEVLHPPKAFENSFLYRLECWRENLNSKQPTQKYSYGHKHLGMKEKKENFTKGQPLVSLKDDSGYDNDCKVPSQRTDGRLIDDIKLESVSEINHQEPTVYSTKCSVKKMCQCSSEDVDIKSRNIQEQEKKVPRNPYKSYQKSRPDNDSSYKNSFRETAKNKKCADEIEETLANSNRIKKNCDNSDKEKFARDCQVFRQNTLNRESVDEKKASTREYSSRALYREYSSRVTAAQRNKIKYTTYTKAKTLMSDTGNDANKLHPTKIQTKTSFSANVIPAMKNSSAFTKKIAILKRAERNTNRPEIISKTTDEEIINLRTPTRKTTDDIKKINEISKNAYAQTPSRIPVKVMRYGAPAAFSQSIVSTRKTTKPPEPSGIEHCRGDVIENVK